MDKETADYLQRRYGNPPGLMHTVAGAYAAYSGPLPHVSQPPRWVFRLCRALHRVHCPDCRNRK